MPRAPILFHLLGAELKLHIFIAGDLFIVEDSYKMLRCTLQKNAPF